MLTDAGPSTQAVHVTTPHAAQAEDPLQWREIRGSPGQSVSSSRSADETVTVTAEPYNESTSLGPRDGHVEIDVLRLQLDTVETEIIITDPNALDEEPSQVVFESAPVPEALQVLGSQADTEIELAVVAPRPGSLPGIAANVLSRNEQVGDPLGVVGNANVPVAVQDDAVPQLASVVVTQTETHPAIAIAIGRPSSEEGRRKRRTITVPLFTLVPAILIFVVIFLRTRNPFFGILGALASIPPLLCCILRFYDEESCP